MVAIIAIILPLTQLHSEIFSDNNDIIDEERMHYNIVTAYDRDITLSWQDAVAYCNNLNTGENVGWHLPNIKEAFAGRLKGWTSTTYKSSTGKAYSFLHPLAEGGNFGSSTFLVHSLSTNNKSDIRSFYCIRYGD